MNIAVTYENGEIFQHFGHTKQFKVYNISDGEITNTEIVDSGNSGHGALATLLANHNIDILICGGIGGGAQTALQYNPDVKCNHHGDDHQHNCHSHEDSNHQCGSSSHHGCGGGHSCH